MENEEDLNNPNEDSTYKGGFMKCERKKKKKKGWLDIIFQGP